MKRKLISAVFVLGLSVASTGLLGCNKSDAATASTASASSGAEAPNAGPAIVNVVADKRGFTPSSVEVKKGSPTLLVFMRTTDDTCAKQVIFPDLSITKDLPLNLKVAVALPVADARTLTFQCGMGMFKGKIVVD